MKNCDSKTQIVEATVTALSDQQATIQLQSSQQKSCVHCQDKGGCHSLSLYQLIYAKRPLLIDNDNYQLGEKLTISFTHSLIQHSIYYLLGLPLLGFILGVLLGWQHHELLGFFTGLIFAIIGLIIGRRQSHKLLIKSVAIQRTQPT